MTTFSNVTSHTVQHLRVDARWIDVREPNEYAEGHVPGAHLVPLATVEAANATWDPAQPLVILCRSGGRSRMASTLLAKKGFTSVYNLDGGIQEWAAAGKTVCMRRHQAPECS
jgi:rhodanese-related sulfurtransferase